MSESITGDPYSEIQTQLLIDTETERTIALQLARQAAFKYVESAVIADEASRRFARYTFYFVGALLFDNAGLKSDLESQVQGWWNFMSEVYEGVSGEELEFPEIDHEPTVDDLRELYRCRVTNSYIVSDKLKDATNIEVAQAVLDQSDGNAVYSGANPTS